MGFRDGGTVTAGQVLFRIDPVQYEAAVKSAEADIVRHRAGLRYAASDLARCRTLFRQNAVSRDALEKAERDERTARGQLMSAEAELMRARDSPEKTVIRAPVSGRAGIAAFTAGNYVSTASGTLAT